MKKVVFFWVMAAFVAGSLITVDRQTGTGRVCTGSDQGNYLIF